LTKVSDFEQNQDMFPSSLVGIGIDIGTTNTKVVAVDLAAENALILASASEPTGASGGELLAIVRRLLRRVIREVDPPVVIGVTSMAETGLLLDPAGEPIGPLLRWNSRNPDAKPSRIIAEIGYDEFGRLSGLPALPKVPLLVWEALRREHDAWSPGARWCGVADLVAFALTGQLVTDHTLAARTGAVVISGNPQQEWDAGMLGLTGMHEGQLPRIAPVGEPAGTLSTSASNALGLKAGLPVFVAGHDHAVGAWAAGVRKPGQVADSLGTAEAVIRILRGPVDPVTVTRTGMTVAWVVTGEHQCLVAGAPGVGSLIAQWSGGFDMSSAELLERRPTRAIVLPYPLGRQTPLPDRNAHVEVLGRPANPALRIRALFEGLAMQARWMHEEQRRVAGERHSGPIHVLGGPGASNALWLSIKGAVFTGPAVRVVSAEPVAAGAAMLAGVRSGIDVGRIGTRPLDPPDSRYGPVFKEFVATARRQLGERR
jgi:xylulokinase